MGMGNKERQTDDQALERPRTSERSDSGARGTDQQTGNKGEGADVSVVDTVERRLGRTTLTT